MSNFVRMNHRTRSGSNVNRRFLWMSVLAGNAILSSNVNAAPPEARSPESIQVARPSPEPLESLEDLMPRVEPWDAQSSSPAASVVLGRFTSNQVNVDAMGNNIVGDAANEPSIAVDPTNPNRMAIGWREFTTIASNFRMSGYAYTADKGSTWTFPGVVRPAEFASDPVLNADAAGNFYYYSLQTGRGPVAWPCYMYKSFDGGQTWPQDVYAFGGDKGWYDIDRTPGPGSGYIYAAWSPNPNAGCCPPNTFSRSVDGGLTWMTPIQVPASQFSGTIVVAPDGAVYTVGSAIGGTPDFRVVRSSNAWNSAETPVFDLVSVVDLDGVRALSSGPNPGGLLGQAVIVADHSNGPTRGHLYVLSSVQRTSVSDPLDVMFSRSTDRGNTWSAPARINDDSVGNGAYQWFGTISVAPNGRIDAVWNDTRNDATPSTPTFSELRYSWSLDGGTTWAASEVVTPAFNHFLGYPQQNKLGDYYDMESDNAGADLAFAATFNGEQDVYYVRLTPDCNSNGVADVTDIANLTSADCDGNLIPDECDPNLDCNNNTVQDICDIAATTSQDCDSNRVPDECQPNSDCNANMIQDICDVVSGLSTDCDADFILDACEFVDCNSNLLHDACDLLVETGTSSDCNENGVPDECDIASATSLDVNMDGVPDECLVGACCLCDQCSLLDEADCLAQQGIFQGVAELCTPSLCQNPANDNCPAATVLPSVVSQSVSFDNRCATTDGPTSVSCEAGPTLIGRDLWYQWVAPCSGTATITLCGGAENFDTVIAAYTSGATCACPGPTGSPLTCGDDSCGTPGGPSIISGPTVAGQCYTIQVGGWNALTGAEQMDISVACGLGPFVENPTVIHTITGPIPGSLFGWVGADVRDVDGDGVHDILTSAPGAARGYLYSGLTGDLLFTFQPSPPEPAGNLFGYSMADLGDVNGDGVTDVVIGATSAAGNAGAVYVFSGATGAFIRRIVGQAPGDRFGHSLASAGDINNDGVPDILVGADLNDTNGTDSGRAYVYSGANGALLRTYEAETPGDAFGGGAANLGDVDWDGVDDHVIGAPNAIVGAGRAYVYSGRTGALLLPPLLPGPTGVEFGRFFVSPAGDVNHDGIRDIFVGDYPESGGNGRSYIFSGANGTVLHNFPGPPGAGEGITRGAHDFDLDGYADSVVGRWTSGVGAAQAGQAVIYSGRDGSILQTITSRTAGENFGYDAIGIGDVNGDGRADVIVTAATGDRLYVIAGEVEPGVGYAFENRTGGSRNRSLVMGLVAFDSTGPANSVALRVDPVQLQTPNPANSPCCPPPDFSAYESGTCTAVGETAGCARWVGPPTIIRESQGNLGLGTFRAARLQCTPYYHDWAAEGDVALYGAEILPSSTYELTGYAASCAGGEASCNDVSVVTTIVTARYGDLAAPFNPPAVAPQPDALDLTAVVNKFRSVAGAPSKTFAQNQPNVLELNADVSALDVVAIVDGFRGLAYPYSGPCPCPSPVVCNATPCTGPSQCAGGVCVSTCAGGDAAGLPCIDNLHCPGGSCGTGFCRDRCGRCN